MLHLEPNIKDLLAEEHLQEGKIGADRSVSQYCSFHMQIGTTEQDSHHGFTN